MPAGAAAAAAAADDVHMQDDECAAAGDARDADGLAYDRGPGPLCSQDCTGGGASGAGAGLLRGRRRSLQQADLAERRAPDQLAALLQRQRSDDELVSAWVL